MKFLLLIYSWAWIEEWYGLTMDDIREIERQTQLALQRKMGNGGVDAEEEGKLHAQSPSLSQSTCI